MVLDIGTSANAGPTTTQNRILLGTATITAGGAGKTTTFQISSLFNSPNLALGNGNEGNTLTKTDGWDLDLTNNGGKPSFITGAPPPTYTGANNVINTFTVVANVPEPGSLALGAVATSAVALAAWRRWRSRATP
jgi:hypothetical protein